MGTPGGLFRYADTPLDTALNDDHQLTQVSRPDGWTVDLRYDAAKDRHVRYGCPRIPTATGSFRPREVVVLVVVVQLIYQPLLVAAASETGIAIGSVLGATASYINDMVGIYCDQRTANEDKVGSTTNPQSSP